MSTSQGARELHALLFLSAIILVAALLIGTSGRALRPTVTELDARIAVEHAGPVTVTVNNGERNGRSIADITHDGAEKIFVSVPDTWQLREVRGAALENVPSDPPSLGFTRWHLPSKATASFWAPAFDALTIRNASSAPLLIEGRRVNVVTGKVEEKSLLIKEEARIW